MLKAIETVYGGYKFRSRLEARWGVFFDAMGIQYRYELEGYDLGSAGYYLPDFLLPTYNLFAEIKPIYKILDKERLKAVELSKQSGCPVLMLFNCSEKQTHFLFFKGEIWSISLMACKNCNGLGFFNLDSGVCLYPGGSCEGGCTKDSLRPLNKLDYFNSEQHQKLLSSTLLAQQARFEFGQTPVMR